MAEDPLNHKPDKLIDRHDLLRAYMTTHYTRSIAVLVRIERDYDRANDEFCIASSMARCVGGISKEILIDNEYLLFLFKDEFEADQYLQTFVEVLHAELWVNGACVSEV
jgi:hypothetical protein